MMFLEKNQILTVYELHMYELLKLLLRSINNLHKQEFLNNMFCFSKNSRMTRSTELALLDEPLCNTKIERFSIKCRASKLFNLLKCKGILPPEIIKMNISKIPKVYHEIKNVFLLPKC